MKKDGYYSSGQFVRLAQVSVRTIRYYDKINILKPSYLTESGARFYTDSDLARLQQVLLLKYLGFSLDDIRDMLVDEPDSHFMLNSLNIQKKLVQDRIEQMQLVEDAIENTVDNLSSEDKIDWSHMLNLIHLTGVEKSIKTQYQDAGNISARIRLHRDYSVNTEGWFPWLYLMADIRDGMKILELGCGNGAFWTENYEKIPENVSIVISDISEGMIRDARRSIAAKDLECVEKGENDAFKSVYGNFSFRIIDAADIPFEAENFDMVIANHVLFYCDDISKVCSEISRVLKTNGKLVCSTYGTKHMKEITNLVQQFDPHVVLAAENLYEIFGLENGEKILSRTFGDISCVRYEDEIRISDEDPLIEYILSCHGNQNQVLLNRYREFSEFVRKKVRKCFVITKDAGAFICNK